MTSFAFLTDEWVTQARLLREEYRVRMRPVRQPVRMNLVVTEVPFGPGAIDACLDTTAGDIEINLGHLLQPDLTVTLSYAIARTVFVDGDPGVAMQAWMTGAIRVDGDLPKLLTAMQMGSADPATIALASRIKEITS